MSHIGTACLILGFLLLFLGAGAVLRATHTRNMEEMGALAAACFVKAFGITFLAQPRGEHARLWVAESPSGREMLEGRE